MIDPHTLPYVRFARRQDTAFSKKTYVHAYDHRLFYCIEGSGCMTIEGREYKLTRGTLLMWKSGLEYRFSDFSSIKTIALNFDITSEHKRSSTPIPPSTDKSFDKTQIFEAMPFPYELPDIVYLNGCERIYPRIKEINDEFSTKRIGYEEICASGLLEIFVYCGREKLNEKADKGEAVRSELLEYIRNNLESRLTYESMGEIFHYHPNHINRIVKKQTGMTFHNYVRFCRTERAIHLLESTDIPVGEIAQRLCFADLKSFSRCFKLSTGHTPTYYRYSKE